MQKVDDKPKPQTVGQEMISLRFQGEIKDFDMTLKDVPKFIMDCPVSANWLEYKGETFFGILNYERSLKARRPMIDLCPCVTKGFNGIVEKTVQYSQKHFRKSRLER